MCDKKLRFLSYICHSDFQDRTNMDKTTQNHHGSAAKSFSKTYLTVPGECNGEKELPVWQIADKIIEVATLHANSWGVGYKRLIVDNHAWVLSRVAIEMSRYPKVNESYTLTTWIEDYNRHFSERNVEITDSEGSVIGYARTIWVVINLTTRESQDISALEYIRENALDKQCPIDKMTRIRQVEHVRESRYTFQYSDIDFNRHVNSVRYICLLMNQWTIDRYDSHSVRRFEISYLKEAHAGEEVTIGIDDTTDDCLLEILHGQECLCRARILFEERPARQA